MESSYLTVLVKNLRGLPGFAVGMGMVLVIWVLSVFAWLEPADHLLYDFFVSSIPQPASADHDVLLLETAAATPYDWVPLSNKLLSAGARQIVFISPLSDDELRALAASPVAASLLIGRALHGTSSADRHTPSFALPQELAEQLKTGVLAMPGNGRGSHRSQWATYRAGPRTLPTVEKIAALHAGRPSPPATFLINFHKGYELPRVSASRMAKESSVEALVKGKTVLIGYAPAPYLAQFNGPGLPPNRLLTQLEFHALALDTLLMDKVVAYPGIATLGGLLLSLGLLLVLAFQPLHLRSAFWAALTLIACLHGLAWLALRFFDIWLPTLELSLLTLLVLTVVFRAKARADDLRLRQLFTETSRKLENQLQLAGFAESKEHWVYVANLVDQVLQLDRTILLEGLTSDHRIREIQSLRCSFGDIDELRRDYQRFPYTEAIAKGGMIEIDTVRHPFFKVSSANERQFLTPLLFGGEVYGFWAFGVSMEKVGELERFRAVADNIAEQIGHLLYQRQLWVKHNALENQPWRRYLDDDTGHLFQNVSKAIVALERRTANLEQMFAGLATAAIVFDLFGRVILINELMAHLLKSAAMSPHDMTIADLIEKLTGRSPGEVRQTIQVLLEDSTPLLLPAQLSDKSPARFILYVRSLRQETETIDAASPFRISGLLLELIDGTELHRLYGIKSGLVNHLNHQINNDLTTILGAIQMMKIDPASREEMQGAIETQGRSAAATMARVQSLLAQEINIDYGGSYPVDPRGVIHGVIDRLQPARAEREIGFDLRMQSTPYLVYANPRELDGTLETCLEFLADDAVQGSKVQIDVTTLADYSTFALRNTGFGIPQDRLDRILAGTAESESGIFEKLRLAMRRIESWGGKVTIRTGLGEGYALTIQLRVF